MGITTAINFLESLNEKLGKVVSWLVVLMMLTIGLDVLFRYAFQFTFIWMVELEIYFFGLLFLLASGYTYKQDKHVRVDVFYAKFSEKRKAWIDLLGTLGFLLPWCYVVLVSSWYYGISSLAINEGSPQAGGLPARYLLKFCITIGFGFLALQALASALKALQIIVPKKV